MKTKFPIIILLLIMQIVFLACGNAESEPPVDLEDGYTNQQIKLFAPSQFNAFETISSVVLEVQYHSGNDIVFPNNYNVRIYERTSNGWIEIPERPVLRLPEDDIRFSVEGKTTVRLFTVDPDLDNYGKTHDLLFYIFGDMKVDGGVRQVAAYVDIELSP